MSRVAKPFLIPLVLRVPRTKTRSDPECHHNLGAAANCRYISGGSEFWQNLRIDTTSIVRERLRPCSRLLYLPEARPVGKKPARMHSLLKMRALSRHLLSAGLRD